jgi:MFS family permease
VFYGWRITAAAFLTLLITVGVPFYGMPFFYDYFIHEFGWTRAQTSSGIAIATILIQPVAGLLLYRFRTRKLILFGAGMLGVSLVSFALGNGSLLLYYFSWAAFMVGYIYSGPLPHQVLLTQWFHRNRGLAIGLAYLGMGVGGAVSQKYVALPLILAYGWRTALIIMGGSMLLLVPVLLWVVRDRPADLGLYPDGDAGPPPDSAAPSLTFRQLLGRSEFWLLAVGSAMSIGAIGSINQHMKLMFQDAHLPVSLVADTTFWILISSLVGRVAMGWLADRSSKKYVMLAACLFVAATVPMLLVIDRPGVPLMFAVSFGFGLGADFMLIPLIGAQMFGSNSLARVMGIVLPVDSIGQACCPFVLGVLRDRFGDYRYGIEFTFALALGGVLAVMLLPGRSGKGSGSTKIAVPVALGSATPSRPL